MKCTFIRKSYLINSKIPKIRHFSELTTQYTTLDSKERANRCVSICNEYNNSSKIHFLLNSSKNSIKFAMLLRDDVQSMLKQNNDLKFMDESLKAWLSAVFSPDALKLQRITFENSSGNILESVAHGESVHRVRSLSELKRRLGSGRRCYAFFHDSMPNDPLVFIHVALTHEISPSLSHINMNSTETNPTSAIFYSVNSPFSALSKYLLFSIFVS